jgi:hypothetical protein
VKEKVSQNGASKSSIRLTEGRLESQARYNYSSESELGVGFNTSAIIEGKIFRSLEKAYIERDYHTFLKLYSFFLESFPHSSQKGILDEKKKNFFYREELNRKKLRKGLVEITYPDAKSLKDLGDYFDKLKINGIQAVQLNVVQFLGTPVYLFAKFEKPQGYYFSTKSGETVDNVLGKIVDMAHTNGLKLYASFPLRHHPLLSDQRSIIIDESWNAIQNRTSLNLKLDLLNPRSKVFLEDLIDSLMATGVDGIVFKDDFTYDITEGFSTAALNRYTIATGRTVVFNNMFIPIDNERKQQFNMLTTEEFDDVALWRTREIKQLLWELTERIRKENRNFRIGLEVTPEMLLGQKESVKWYSTGLHFLRDLNIDFYVLKWRKFNSELESDSDTYKTAAVRLRDSIPRKVQIYLKVPLSGKTKNIIQLNRKIKFGASFQENMRGVRLAVGPVNRLKSLDFIN